MKETEVSQLAKSVAMVVNGSSKLPWVLCLQPILILIVVSALWLPAFIAVLVIQVDDHTGSMLLIDPHLVICRDESALYRGYACSTDLATFNKYPHVIFYIKFNICYLHNEHLCLNY